MTKSKNSSKKSFSVSTRDFDPENEDFGSEVSGVLARNKKGASLSHGHMGDLKSSANFDDGFNSKKYSGKKVSRKELAKEDFEAFDCSEDSDVDSACASYGSSCESVNVMSDKSEVSEMSDSQESDYSSEMSEDEDEASNDKGKDSELSARMRELEMVDEKAFELISKPRPEDDAQKSQHVRNQLVKYDEYVDFRFKLQPLLNSVNRFPTNRVLRKAKTPANSRIATELDSSVQELEGLMRDLLDLSATELSNDGISIPQVSNPKSTDSKLQHYWDEMTRMDAALDPFARESLQKWHNKMTLSSDLKAKKTLRMLNQDPYQQVQIALQDEERLLARTRILRDSSKRRLGPSLEDSREYSDIFDDNDFYQVLLKDWTASHGALSSTTASAMSAILLSGNANKKQHRDNVDQRASKGRKLRYDVHAKLMNYMVPHIEKGAWMDSKIDEFYASLLGQSISN